MGWGGVGVGVRASIRRRRPPNFTGRVGLGVSSCAECRRPRRCAPSQRCAPRLPLRPGPRWAPAVCHQPRQNPWRRRWAERRAGTAAHRPLMGGARSAMRAAQIRGAHYLPTYFQPDAGARSSPRPPRPHCAAFARAGGANTSAMRARARDANLAVASSHVGRKSDHPSSLSSRIVCYCHCTVYLCGCVGRLSGQRADRCALLPEAPVSSSLA